MQQMQLWVFWAIVTAFVVCGCILTRKPRKSYQLKPFGQRGRTNISQAVSLSKKKGAVIGLAAAYRLLKKLNQVCDRGASAAAIYRPGRSSNRVCGQPGTVCLIDREAIVCDKIG